MNVNNLFPSKYLKAHDLGDKHITVTIRNATLEDMGFGSDKERKLVLWFEKATKGMVMNRTNAMIVASLYGPETDAWIGKAITLYSARVKAFGSWHDAVRVKEQIPARNVGAERMTDAMQEPPPIDDEDDLLDVDEGHDRHDGPGGNDGGHGDNDQYSIDPATGEILGSGSDPQGVADHDGDISDLWNDDAPAPASEKAKTASQAQLTRLHILGTDFYGSKAEWDKKRPELVAAATTGAKSSSKELLPQEADLLIKGLEKRLREKQAQARAAQAAQPAMVAA